MKALIAAFGFIALFVVFHGVAGAASSLPGVATVATGSVDSAAEAVLGPATHPASPRPGAAQVAPVTQAVAPVTQAVAPVAQAVAPVAQAVAIPADAGASLDRAASTLAGAPTPVVGTTVAGLVAPVTHEALSAVGTGLAPVTTALAATAAVPPATQPDGSLLPSLSVPVVAGLALTSPGAHATPTSAISAGTTPVAPDSLPAPVATPGTPSATEAPGRSPVRDATGPGALGAPRLLPVRSRGTFGFPPPARARTDRAQPGRAPPGLPRRACSRSAPPRWRSRSRRLRHPTGGSGRRGATRRTDRAPGRAGCDSAGDHRRSPRLGERRLSHRAVPAPAGSAALPSARPPGSLRLPRRWTAHRASTRTPRPAR